MIVSKEELEELQGFMQKQIKELEKQENSDSSDIFDLQAMDSNIALLISCAELQGTEAIELGTRDGMVKDALQNYRNDIAKANVEDAYVGEVSFFAAEALANLNKIKDVLPASEKIFSSNINWLLNRLIPEVRTLAGLQGNSRLVQKLKLNDVVQAAAQTSSASPSAAKTAATKTATKTETAEKQSRTKAAPAKAAAKTTATKTAASKTSAARATATKTAAKATSARTSKAKAAPEPEAPKKRGRPRKTDN